MLDSSDQQRLHKLLSDTIPLLCKRSLGYSSELSVEAFIGVTLSGEDASNEVVMVSFKETLLADGRVSSYVWSELPPSNTNIPPSFIEPVAFHVSESESCDRRSPQTVDSVNGHDSGLERHGEYEPNWDDGRCWAECDEPATIDDAKGDSSHLPSFPVKVEEYDDITKMDDEPEDFETDADLETTGNSYENPYSSVVHHYSSARCPRGNVNARPHCRSVASRSLKSGGGSRKIIYRQGDSPQALTFQSLPSSSLYSTPQAKMKKSTFPTVNATILSSHSEVIEMSV